MTSRSDDLTSLFTAQPDSPAQPVSYRQGVIMQWNPVTLENTVQVGGTMLTNLPVLGVAEAASYEPGTVVGLMVVGSTWAIIGRFVIPGTPDAADAISDMSSRTATATIDVQQSTSSTTFTDLTTVGPTVDVNVGPSGRAMLFLSTKAGWSVVATDPAVEAAMSAALSGTNTQSPQLVWSAFTFCQWGGTTFSLKSDTIASIYTFSGLTPGLTTFTAKYRSSTGHTVDFSRRTIAVIAL